MRRTAWKAIFALLSVAGSDRQPDWYRVVLVGSTLVTVGLAVLYAYGKATSRW